MSDKIELFVQLLNEKVEAWRPVWAKKISENTYEILPQEYDRSLEKWRFEPGELVACDFIDSSAGKIFAATRTI